MTGWPPLDETHDPALRSWVESARGHPDFPIQNLPLGIVSIPDHPRPRAGVAIGDAVLDLAGAATAGLLPEKCREALADTTLNALLALPGEARRALRRRLSALLSDEAERAAVAPLLRPANACAVHLPARIGDYTDFYAGIHHAEAVGRLFRPDAPLLPNYKHVPIGYHGRASSVRPSGEPVTRPNGQRRPPGDEAPSFGPCRRLDYELELGVWIGSGNALGSSIPIGAAAAHVAGFCLLNDWSARDVQTWEYQPLGPFLAKSFHSTVSPWLVTAEAMAPFRVAQPPRPTGDPAPLPYLWDETDQAAGSFALVLEVAIRSEAMRARGLAPHRVGRSRVADLYWTVAQLVAHHASNGCGLSAGDLLGSGTVSGAGADERGSLLETTRGGGEAIVLPTGEERLFLEDGDEVLLSARAEAPGAVPIGFGECRAVVLPAPPA